jgi:hypothetical protein
MNVGHTTGSVLTQHVNQADAAKQQLGTQSLPHQAYVEKESQHKLQMILEEVMSKEKAERVVKRDAKQKEKEKEKRTLRYTVKGKTVTAIAEPEIDQTV